MTVKVNILSPNSELPFVSSWFELADDGHFWMQGRLYALLKQFRLNHIPTDKPLRGLEIGCGHGVLRSQIERHTQWTVDGADLDADALTNNPSCRGEVYLYNIFDQQHLMKEYYDFIILYDVIEHIKEVKPFLEACLFHLKPGGYVFFNVPALNSLYSNYDRAVGHHRRYDKTMLSRQIEDINARVIHINYWGLIFLPLLWCRKILLSNVTQQDTIIKKGFSSKKSLLNSLIKTMVRLEVAVAPNPTLGSSVMGIAQKKP